MQIVTINVDDFNILSIGGNCYFKINHEGRLFIAPSKCPHRGGPLHLGSRSACGNRIVCPWHDNEYSIKTIVRRALPAVFLSGKVSIIAADGEVRTWKEISPGDEFFPESESACLP
jgi:nitrite reductase/ring-hydroxylating ferredoxin subunit